MIRKISFGNVIPVSQLSQTVETKQSTGALTSKPIGVESKPMPSLLAQMVALHAPENLEVKFFNTLSLNQMTEKYGVSAKKCAEDVNARAGKKGQVLSWIGILPKNQLERLDSIYELADGLRAAGGEKLLVIGIGGSKHTVENILALNGFSDKAMFLSAADPDSIRDFADKNLKDKSKVAVLVASKSGTTLEPSYGFDSIQKILGDEFKNYVCITDSDVSKSKLRQMANSKAYPCGIIHDDCGGRFGAFDDHSLVALAFCGMPKDEMKRMLEASLIAQKKYSIADITKNTALQRAAFNVESITNGKINQYDYYFGDRFEGTPLWNTQLKKESHKSLYKPSGDLVAPAFLHNSTEADLDEGNTTSFYTFNAVKNADTQDYKVINALFNGSLKAYSDRHPVSVVSLKDLSVESIANFIELKHFETLYTGMMLRDKLNLSAQRSEILPEVLQPHVGIYKAEVNKILEKN